MEIQEKENNKPLIILAVMYAVLVVTVIYINVSTGVTISKQNKIIAKQQDVNFNQQQIIELLEQQVADEQAVSNILYDILEVHNLLEEVE